MNPVNIVDPVDADVYCISDSRCFLFNGQYANEGICGMQSGYISAPVITGPMTQ